MHKLRNIFAVGVGWFFAMTLSCGTIYRATGFDPWRWAGLGMCCAMLACAFAWMACLEELR